MWIAVLAVSTAILGVSVGVMWREAYQILKRIEKASKILVQRADKTEKKEQKMNFAEPTKLNWDDLDDEERLEILNR